MSYGLLILDAAGGTILDSEDYTFRYMGEYTYTNDPNADVVIPITSIGPVTHFATCTLGFPVVETNQVVIKPQFGSGTSTATFYLFRI